MQIRVLTNKKFSVLENEFSNVRDTKDFLLNSPTKDNQRIYISNVLFSRSQILRSYYVDQSNYFVDEHILYKHQGIVLYKYNPLLNLYEEVFAGNGNINELIQGYKESLC